MIKTHLNFLYGETAAQTVYPRVLDLLLQFGGTRTVQPVRSSLSLTQRDALLITYGDQVGEEGVAPLRTLREFAEAHLQDAVSGVHLLPFYPYSSDDGFAVIDWFAINPALGTWAEVEEIGRSFDLMFDGVFNHLSARSHWFERFLQDDPAYRDFFVTVEGEADLSRVVRPRALPLLTEFESAAGKRKVWTTFSADQVDLNFKNPEVLLATLNALLFYVGKGAPLHEVTNLQNTPLPAEAGVPDGTPASAGSHLRKGARFVRLDAIAYLWKEIGTSCIHLPQTHRVIQLMRAVLDEVAPDVCLITETNVPHADNLSYLGDGTNEAQLIYNFALPPLVLHSLAAGNAGTLTRWAASLRLPSQSVTFFNFLASHDGIGLNPVRGILSQAEIDALTQQAQTHGGFVSYKQNPDGSKSAYELNINFFDALSNPNDRAEPIQTQEDRFLVAQAIMLALAGMPGIYFHSLFGSRNDRAGAEVSGIPRRINRQKLARKELEEALAAPSSLRARVFSRYKRLLKTRREQAAFHPSGSQQVLSVDERVFALLRQDPESNQRVLCLHNIANDVVPLTWPLPGVAPGRSWMDLLSGQRHILSAEAALVIELTPYQVFWAREE